MPYFGSEVSIVYVCEELDALQGIYLGLITLIALHPEQNHAQNRPQVAICVYDQLCLLIESIRNGIEEER